MYLNQRSPFLQINWIENRKVKEISIEFLNVATKVWLLMWKLNMLLNHNIKPCLQWTNLNLVHVSILTIGKINFIFIVHFMKQVSHLLNNLWHTKMGINITKSRKQAAFNDYSDAEPMFKWFLCLVESPSLNSTRNAIYIQNCK